MLIHISVTPEAKQMRITKISDTRFEVSVRSSAERNQANMELVRVLSAYFNVPPGKIRIITGHKSAGKIIEVIV